MLRQYPLLLDTGTPQITYGLNEEYTLTCRTQAPLRRSLWKTFLGLICCPFFYRALLHKNEVGTCAGRFAVANFR